MKTTCGIENILSICINQIPLCKDTQIGQGLNELIFELPQSERDNHYFQIDLDISNLWSPSQNMQSNDTRMLGLGLIDIAIS